MDRSLFMIVVIVFLVGLVGFLTVWRPQPDISGNVVVDPVRTVQQVANPCDHCAGTPVCASKGNNAIDYENSCLAQCDGARVIFNKACAQIPVITPQ